MSNRKGDSYVHTSANSITALTVLAFGALGASAGQQLLPQYEVAGLPITPLQLSVIRSRGIQEQPPTPQLTRDGMPASPHQITVIRQQLAHKLKTDASDRS